MSVSVTVLSHFQRKVRRLARKFRLLDDELANLIASLKESPRQGANLGAGLYKIRLASKSKGKGKSGGFRVITYYIEQVGEDEVVYLVTIYDKSEESSIDKEDLLTIVKETHSDPESDK